MYKALNFSAFSFDFWYNIIGDDMSSFIPDAYYKSIFDINYDKLSNKGIKVLFFDFDNTIIEHDSYSISEKTKKFFKKINNNFIIYVISNSFNSKKLDNICNELKIPCIKRSMKPLGFGYRKVKFKGIKNKEIAMIGDQLLTDIYGANRRGYYSILVDPLKQKTEVVFTKFNRIFENKIFNNKENNIKRGSYYD